MKFCKVLCLCTYVALNKIPKKKSSRFRFVRTNILTFCFSFTHVSRGNLVPHFKLNSRGVTCWVAEVSATLCLVTRRMKILKIFNPRVESSPQPSCLQSHACTTERSASFFNIFLQYYRLAELSKGGVSNILYVCL